jgi:uncharacterized protein
LIVVDVNVLVGAHRADLPEHARMLSYLEGVLGGPVAVGAPDHVLAGFLRIVTNRRVFQVPTDMSTAVAFVRAVRGRDTWLPVAAEGSVWTALERLLDATGVTGDDVPDAYLAALAIAGGHELASGDRGFGRFPGLRWINALQAK